MQLQSVLLAVCLLFPFLGVASPIDGVSEAIDALAARQDTDDPELCCSGIPPSYSLCCSASCGVCESVSCDVSFFY